MKTLQGELRLLLSNQNGWLPVAIGVGTALAGAYGAWQSSKTQAESVKQQNKANAANTAATNAANAKMAKQQMDFQEKMSNSAHQRQVADLESAGINKLYAAGGSGSSSPSGAMSLAQSPNVNAVPPTDPIGKSLANGINTGVAAYGLQKDLAQKDASLSLTKAQYNATDANRYVAENTAANLAQKNLDHITNRNERYAADKANQIAIKNEAQTRLIESQLAAKRAITDSQMHNYDSINQRIQSGLGTASKAVDLVNPFNKWMKGSSNSTTTEHYNSNGEHMGSRTTRKH